MQPTKTPLFSDRVVIELLLTAITNQNRVSLVKVLNWDNPTLFQIPNSHTFGLKTVNKSVTGVGTIFKSSLHCHWADLYYSDARLQFRHNWASSMQSCQDPTSAPCTATKLHMTMHLYAWRHMPCCTGIYMYIVLHVCILYSACTWQGPMRLFMYFSNKEFDWSREWQWKQLWGICKSNLHSWDNFGR